jgi:hypothetical protein
MFERGVDVCYETIRAWCDRFGQEYYSAPNLGAIPAVGDLVRCTNGAWMIRRPQRCPRGHRLGARPRTADGTASIGLRRNLPHA